MATEAQERLASALEALAAHVVSSPRTVIGAQFVAVGGPGSGNVTGARISAVAGPGSRGNVTGMKVEATLGADPAADLIREMRSAANDVRANKAARGWVQGLVDRAKALKDRAIDVGIAAAVEKGISSVFG